MDKLYPMHKLLCFCFVVSILLMTNLPTQAKNEGGILNKHHEITTDLLSFAWSGEVGLDYKFVPSKQFALALDLHLLTDAGYVIEYDNGYMAGFGLLFYGPTGMPAPIGFYAGGKVDVMAFEKEATAARLRLVVGRDFYWGKGFVFDITTELGILSTTDPSDLYYALRLKLGYAF